MIKEMEEGMETIYEMWDERKWKYFEWGFDGIDERVKQVGRLLAFIDNDVLSYYERVLIAFFGDYEKMKKIRVNFILLSPEEDKAAIVISKKIVKKFTHQIVLLPCFFDTLDEGDEYRCIEILLHELVHCYREFSKLKDMEEEEKNVEGIARHMLLLKRCD